MIKNSRRAEELEAPAPGKKVIVPIMEWGDYKRIHGLEVANVEWDPSGRILVQVKKKQDAQDKEG